MHDAGDSGEGRFFTVTMSHANFWNPGPYYLGMGNMGPDRTGDVFRMGSDSFGKGPLGSARRELAGPDYLGTGNSGSSSTGIMRLGSDGFGTGHLGSAQRDLSAGPDHFDTDNSSLSRGLRVQKNFG